MIDVDALDKVKEVPLIAVTTVLAGTFVPVTAMPTLIAVFDEAKVTAVPIADWLPETVVVVVGAPDPENMREPVPSRKPCVVAKVPAESRVSCVSITPAPAFTFWVMPKPASLRAT